MTWAPVSFKGDTLKINLTFANPLEVSQSALNPDKVIIQVLDKQLFQTKDRT